jgi:hypothetical protein
MALARLLLGRIEEEEVLFSKQVINFVTVVVAGVGVWAIGMIFPDFFVYPYFKWAGWGTVLRFWPLFLEGVAINLLPLIAETRWPMRARESKRLFEWELVTYSFAGVWEELGFRWAFICYVMIVIVVANSVLGAVFGWHDPMYALYGFVALVIHFTTLTLMDPVLYDSHQPFLIFGALIANWCFYNGHKYEGFYGALNAWYCGLIFLYATLTYGLWTAIVVHAVYDVQVAVLRYIMQKTR